eukprot:gnl/TRDRNA2_/TRDRNA2_177059_c0_seq3.p1 gnl/TRDRNA2_/TRDRNA2_177059_c0~~gnl/TRDRNA2_/TRDRNA2_177059_c0_seq3.p1  ORF type:complete len:407 (+),score=79.40 gnl/TRDRNA2_/TRDRNA2_177059_c0_seq3:286-1506(+)
MRVAAVGNEEESEEVSSNGPNPEEWRMFRQRLISGGLKLTTDNSSAVAEADGTDPSAAAPAQRQVVAPGNEQLLRNQSQALYEEYIQGTWAHESPVEAGGLLLRMPVEGQLIHFLQDGDAGEYSIIGDAVRRVLKKELPSAREGEGKQLFDSWAGNLPYVYRLCQRYMKEQLQELMSTANDGKITVQADSAVGRLLQLMQLQNQEWQQVVLVLKSTAEGASGVVLNRPLGARLDSRLATLLLKQTGEAEELADLMVAAFGDKACIYHGGPADEGSGAILVHGFGSLDGAVEVAPGTGIYTGGERAAIEAVDKGTKSPLDFRWFIGRHNGLKTLHGAWRPAACARPVALKQCLGLPKPLWHEVMELMGGASAKLSLLEIQKRDDLMNEAVSGASPQSNATKEWNPWL